MPRRGHGTDAENGAHWGETARAGDSHSDTAERELPRMDRSTTLTAHLARAAGTRAVAPVGAAANVSATVEIGDDAEDRRCAASVISGQRWRRPAAEGR